jgi:hypothetical protein
MEYKEYLTTWAVETLSVPNELLNSLPICPFAKSAMLDGYIDIVKVDDYVLEIKETLSNWNDKFQAVIFVCADDVDAGEFVESVKRLNSEFMPRDLVLLEDHKDIKENFHGIPFNNGRYNIVIAQRLHKINEASRSLDRKGYYINWSDEMYDDVVRWRFTG